MDVAGVGKIHSGNYENINISGFGTICGNIYTDRIEISGKGKSLGKIECKDLYVSGTFKSEKNIKSSEEINISGAAKFASIDCNYINVSGKIALDKSLNFNKVDMEGWLTILENCQGQEFVVDGKVNIKGLLSADIIDISLRGKSYVKDIGGEEIIIKNYHSKIPWPISITFGWEKKVKSNLIEGDKIRLSSNECGLVRGGDIIIEENCKIDCIEYTNSLEIDDKSIVLNVIKIENKESLDLEKY